MPRNFHFLTCWVGKRLQDHDFLLILNLWQQAVNILSKNHKVNKKSLQRIRTGYPCYFMCLGSNLVFKHVLKQVLTWKKSSSFAGRRQVFEIAAICFSQHSQTSAVRLDSFKLVLAKVYTTEIKAIQHFKLTIFIHQHIFMHIMKIHPGHTSSQLLITWQSSGSWHGLMYTSTHTISWLQDNILNMQQFAMLDSWTLIAHWLVAAVDLWPLPRPSPHFHFSAAVSSYKKIIIIQ